MLAALGYKRGTRVYLAGAHMYNGEAKMAILKNLYPNIVTKEDILTPEEIAPFRNHSSQVRHSLLILQAVPIITCSRYARSTS